MDDCHSPGTARIQIAAESWRRLVPDPEGVVTRALKAALDAADVELSGAEQEGDLVLDVMLTDDAALRDLNRAWRGKDAPTNVLSFPSDPDLPRPPGEPLHLGDIAIAAETVAREAQEAGRSVADHLAHMVVHGVLHVVGYDHEDDAEAELMEALETRVLAGLGIADPYAVERAA